MSTEDVRDQREELAIEEADAWFEYLEATQAEAASGRYDEVEPWAWARLKQRLRAVERRRSKIRPAAA
jgi:hypothetical protein